MQQMYEQSLRKQFMERLTKAGLSESKAKETITNLLSAYSLFSDRKELIREVEELAVLFEEDGLYEISESGANSMVGKH